MSFEYKKNCLTCEFGFDNDHYDEEYNPVHPDKLIITCACSGNPNGLYGKEVSFDHVCEFWGESLSEFIRVEKKVSYDKFYEKKLELVDR